MTDQGYFILGLAFILVVCLLMALWSLQRYWHWKDYKEAKRRRHRREQYITDHGEYLEARLNIRVSWDPRLRVFIDNQTGDAYTLDEVAALMLAEQEEAAARQRKDLFL